MENVISIIIPTCNRNDKLKRTIDSVIQQGLSAYEILVVNDSDLDIENKIIESYLNYPVKFIKNNGNHGAASARNFGVNRSIGEYITFIDDDDVYLPGRLKNMLKTVREENYDIISSGRFFERGDFCDIVKKDGQLYGVIDLNNILYKNDIDIGFFMKRSDFLTLGGFDENLIALEDWDFIIRALARFSCFKIKRLDLAVNIDRDRPRVSDKTSQAFLELAKKYKFEFGRKWHEYMMFTYYRMIKKIKLKDALWYSFSLKTCKPIEIYLRHKRKKYL
ncbi:MAG: glycosyltransferase family 2 protein [Cetobacterium sp.]